MMQCNEPSLPYCVGSAAPSMNTTYIPTSVLQQPLPVPPFISRRAWGGVGGFATPPQPTPPLCAPPLTVASSLGNPQMPSNSLLYNTSSPMGYNFRLAGKNSTCKRRIEDEPECRPKAKQLITEEKVSASLNSLHLSSSFTTHQLGNQNTTDEEFLDCDASNETPATSAASSSITGPRLYISDEVSKISIDQALPEAILKNYRKPSSCMEVVLWKPRSPILPPLGPPSEVTSAEDNSENDTSVPPSTVKESSCSQSSTPTVSSPDSGVSGVMDSMDEDILGRIDAGMSSSATHYQMFPGAVGVPIVTAPVAPIIPPPSGAPVIPITEAPVVIEENNNSSLRASAYTHSWVEENNNTGLRDLNLQHLPPLPDDDDDMEL